jgi:hypothetical protein
VLENTTGIFPTSVVFAAALYFFFFFLSIETDSASEVLKVTPVRLPFYLKQSAPSETKKNDPTTLHQ